MSSGVAGKMSTDEVPDSIFGEFEGNLIGKMTEGVEFMFKPPPEGGFAKLPPSTTATRSSKPPCWSELVYPFYFSENSHMGFIAYYILV